MSQSFFILGAGGHAKVVVDVLLQRGQTHLHIFDDHPAKLNTTLLGYKVEGSQQDLLYAYSQNNTVQVIIAVGQNETRQSIYEVLLAHGIKFGNAIHPHVVIAPSVRLGQGLMIMAGVVINPDVTIADSVIVNTGAVVEHDCVIGAHSHIAPNATLCGDVRVGESTLIGAGAIILPGIKIGSSCTIGAGAVVTQDIPDGKTAVGIPAHLT